jgi:membrane associated rhomboid family serine protease
MVIPIYDEDPLARDTRPYVTYGIIITNVVVFLLTFGSNEGVQSAVLQNFAVFPATVADRAENLSVLPPIATLTTYMFLHAGWLHLLFNMLFLWVYGDNVEDALGSVRFALFYFLCGIASAAAYIVSAPNVMGPLIGASGAVAGVVGAYLMLRPCARVKVLIGPIPVGVDAFWVIGFWALTQVWHVLVHDRPEVAWWAHIGGLVAGALLVIVMRQPDVELFECMRPQEPAQPLADADAGKDTRHDS